MSLVFGIVLMICLVFNVLIALHSILHKSPVDPWSHLWVCVALLLFATPAALKLMAM